MFKISFLIFCDLWKLKLSSSWSFWSNPRWRFTLFLSFHYALHFHFWKLFFKLFHESRLYKCLLVIVYNLLVIAFGRSIWFLNINLYKLTLLNAGKYLVLSSKNFEINEPCTYYSYTYEHCQNAMTRFQKVGVWWIF